jgi:hypothetical protein
METMTKRNVKTLNPFRAGSGLFPSCLAGRVAVLNIFSSRLYSTITGSPKNIIVHGRKKMGKTCLLIKMEEISFTKKLLTVSTITSPEKLKNFVENITVRLFSEIRSQGLIENGECAQFVQQIQSSPDDINMTELEIIFTDFLQLVWGMIESRVPAIFISIDDIDLVNDAKRALLFIHNVTQTLYRKDCPIVFATSCSTEFYEQVRKKNPKLTDSFETIESSLLLPSSLENALRVPLWELGVPFDESVVVEIGRRSGGFPYYLQHIAHYVFEEMNEEFDTLALRRGYEKSMQYLRRDIFAPLENDLPLNEKKILVTLYQENAMTFSELLKHTKLPRGSVASCLKRLKEKQLIRQNEKIYSIYDRAFGNYLRKKMGKE